jgi:hypothetical protein
MRFLEDLALGANNLKELPPFIGKLRNLRFLNLSENKLTSLPEEIGKLKNLEEFIATKNDLNQIPKSIGKLRNLKMLNLSGNLLENLPKTMENLKSLETIKLEDNNLRKMPKVIKKITSLKETSFEGNPFEKKTSISYQSTNFENHLDYRKSKNEQYFSLEESLEELKKKKKRKSKAKKHKKDYVDRGTLLKKVFEDRVAGVIATDVPVYIENKKTGDLLTGRIDILSLLDKTFYTCFYKPEVNLNLNPKDKEKTLLVEIIPEVTTTSIIFNEMFADEFKRGNYDVKCLVFNKDDKIILNPYRALASHTIFYEKVKPTAPPPPWKFLVPKKLLDEFKRLMETELG